MLTRVCAVAFGLLATSFVLEPNPAYAVGGDGDRVAPPVAAQPAARPAKTKAARKQVKKAKQKQTELFRKRYDAARELVLSEKFDEAISAFSALKQDDHPDVANYIGFASRKLGRYDDAKVWYEKALAADPKHVRTWQYYGMWHAESGNRLKAADYLETIKSICGTECIEYAELKKAIDGDIRY